MKKIFLLIVMATTVISCGSKKTKSPNGNKTIKDNLKNLEQHKSINLKQNQYSVKKIEFGKDGYVATLQDFNGTKWQMIASIVNMEKAFVQVKKSDIISVQGEYFEKTYLIKAQKITVHHSLNDVFKSQDVIVGFKNSKNVKQTIKELEQYKGVTFVKMIFDVGDTQIALFKVPAGKEKEFVNVFSQNKNVKYAELNKIMKMMKK